MYFLGHVWDLFRGDRSMIAVAVLGAVLSAVAGAIVFGGAAALLHGTDSRLAIAAGAAVLAFPVTVISTFCNVALIRMAQARFDGGHCSARDGLRAAWKRLPAILGWSLLAVGVGVLLEQIGERTPRRRTGAVVGAGRRLVAGHDVRGPAAGHRGRRRPAGGAPSAAIFRDRWARRRSGPSPSVRGVVGSVPGRAGRPRLAARARHRAGGRGRGPPDAAVAISNTLQELFALAVYRQQCSIADIRLDPTQLDVHEAQAPGARSAPRPRLQGTGDQGSSSVTLPSSCSRPS